MRWAARDTVAAIGALVVVGVMRWSGCFQDDGWVDLEALPPGMQASLAQAVAQQEFGVAQAEIDAVDFSALPRDLDRLMEPEGEGAVDPMVLLFAAFERCGTVDLSAFDGHWAPPAEHPEWAGTVVEDGRVQAGTVLRAEHCAVHVVERTETRLVAVAVTHEDVHDPGDAWIAYLRLERAGERLSVCVGSDLDRLDASCVALTRDGG